MHNYIFYYLTPLYNHIHHDEYDCLRTEQDSKNDAK